MNLRVLDRGLFSLEMVAYHHVDTFGRLEMPDALMDPQEKL